MSASAWLAASVLAVAATLASCGGDESAPVTPTRAPPPATAARASEASSPSATPEVVSTPTPAPVPRASPPPTVEPAPSPPASPSPVREASPTASPSPTPTVTPPPTPTPEPVAFEYTELTLGEPRTLPAEVALFYRVGGCGACNACGMGFGDIRRVVFDAAAGEYREDRPAPAAGHLQDLEVSPGGREMAAMVCHKGSCHGSYDAPSVDAEQHLWVSRDGASTWTDLGPTLPAASILAVTSDAILIEEWNHWGDRSWYDITDGEWEELLARLGPLGLDDLEGVPPEWPRLRWAAFGPEAPVPEIVPETVIGLSLVWGWAEGRPAWAGTPGLGGFTWLSQDSLPHGGRVWAGISSDRTLLAANDEQGLQGVYDVTGIAAESGYGTPFVVSESLLVYDEVTCVGFGQTAEVKLVDFATGSIHPVEGLSLPMGVDEQGGNGLLYTLWRVIQFASE